MNPRAFPVTLAWIMAAAPAAAQFELAPPIAETAGANAFFQPLHGDYTGDGNLDILALTESGAGITLFRGDGQGSLVQGADLAREAGQIMEAVQADLDGDGHLDLVAIAADSLRGPRELWLLKGVPGGSFDAQSLGIETDDLQDIVLADLNGDGYLDVVGKEPYSSPEARILYFAGLGAGAFDRDARVASPQRVRSFRISDVNLDSHLDLVIANTAGLPPRVILGQGQGQFSLPVPLVAAGQIVTKVIALEDFDRDGDDDLLEAVAGGGVTLYLNDGAGTFGQPTSLSPEATQVSWAGDLDGDSFKDLVLIWMPFLLSPPVIECFLQSAPGVFTQVSLPAGWELPLRLAVDIDGDGKDDAIGSPGPAYLDWQMNELAPAAGYFGASRPLGLHFGASTELTTADLDGDGDEDILLLGADRQTIAWKELVAPRILAPPRRLLTAPMAVEQMLPVDMDLDGHVDLALALRSPATGLVVSVATWTNSGPASFTQGPAATPVQGGTFKRFEGRDFDADGDMDLMLLFTGTTWGYTVAEVLSNTSPGSPLQHTIAVQESMRAISVTAGRVNGDRLSDLVIQQHSPDTASGRVFVFAGRGGGQFGPPRVLWDDPIASSMSITDFDGDGWDDYIATLLPVGKVIWRRGSPLGAFESPQVLLTPRSQVAPSRFDVLDFDSDGDLDLVTGGVGSAQIFVAKQLSPGVVSDAFAVSPGRIILPLSFMDVDADGDRDVVSLRSSPERLLIHKHLSAVAMGSVFCEGPQSSSRGLLTALGSNVISENRLALRASGLPGRTFAIALASRTFGQPVAPAGAPESLCLTGAIGQFNRAHQILTTEDSGLAVFPINLSSIAQPGGTVAGLPGESWAFQVWYRAPLNSLYSSNLTSGNSVELR